MNAQKSDDNTYDAITPPSIPATPKALWCAVVRFFFKTIDMYST